VSALVIILGPGGWPLSVDAQSAPVHDGPLDTIQVRPNDYALFGAGGNIVVQVGPEGVVLVNTGTAAAADGVLAAVRALTPRPIRYVINTSDDAHVVGGNARLAGAGVSLNPNAFSGGGASAAVLAREEVLLRMSAPSGQASAFPVAAWPTETFTAKQRAMFVNGEGFQVVHMPAAHSDGDSVVVLRRAEVIVTGDILDLGRFPVIDIGRGGSIEGEVRALNRLVDLTIPAMPLVWQDGQTVLVPGFGRLADQADLVEYRDMVTIVRDTVQALIDKGMTVEQVQAANPTSGFRRRYGADTGPWTTDMFVEAVYRSLAGKDKS
jgi:glyoxylase-like metal-dependent hydrolase (beta-lactamase superfamily II)